MKIAHKLCILACISLCTCISFSAYAKQNKQKSQEEWIVVFVHGTFALKPHASLRTLLAVAKDELEGTLYKKSVAIMRDNDYFYRNQAMQPTGLHKIVDGNFGENTPGLFAQLYDTIHKNSLSNYQKNSYYTFGWSGLLSAKGRYQEAQKLYKQLKDLLQDLAKKGKRPKVKIIAYSHGGNVALNLGRVCSEHDDTNLIVDELVLLGTPIQRETARYCAQDTFAKIYNIYSRKDFVQVSALDRFPHARTPSRRCFRDRASQKTSYKVTPKITQIEIKISSPHYTPLDSNQQPTGRIVRRSPGHIELWFFGWLAENTFVYRRHFPLYPLPLAVFIPKIIDTVTTYTVMDQTTPAHVVMELMPYEGQVEMRRRHHKKITRLPFLSSNEIESCKQQALKSWPKNFTYELYNAHMNNAIKIYQNRYTTQRKGPSRHMVAPEELDKTKSK